MAPGKPAKRKKTLTATAAPKATTRFEVTVIDTDTKQPLAGAAVRIVGGKVNHPSTKTNKAGVWLSNAVGPGNYSITVTLKHFGAPVAQKPAPAPPTFPVVGPVKVAQTVAANVAPTATTTVKVEMARAESTVKLSVVDESHSNIVLIGAKVKVGKHAEKDTEYLKTIEMVLTAGEHDVRVKKPGHSESAQKPDPDVVAGKKTGVKSSKNVMKTKTDRDPGVVDFVIVLATPMSDKSVEILLPMTSDWGRVSNGTDIKVANVAFPDWFNNTFRKDKKYKHPDHPIVTPATFVSVFNKISQFRSDPLTLEEFVALFVVMIHETGGSLEAILEGVQDHKTGQWKETTLKYYFEGGTKHAYNDFPNRLAGDLLAGLKGKVFSTPALTPPTKATASTPAKANDQALIAAWNGKTFPAKLGKVTKAQLRECDFLKYIGRGYIQVTWYSNYVGAKDFVDLLAKRYGKTGTRSDILDQIPTDDMMNAISSDPAIAFALMRGWFDQGRWPAYMGVNKLDFRGFTRKVNSGPKYASVPDWCGDLRKAMIAAGPKLGN